MSKHQFTSICMILICLSLNAQQDTKKGLFYFSLGSHRAFYTPSSIRFVSSVDPGFDFTLEKLKARDDGGIKFHNSPQYSYNIGYYSYRRKFGIEYQFDHVKYIMVQGQVARLRGRIGEVEYNTDTVVHAGLVMLEHTDGANYAMLNFVKWKNLLESRDMKRSLDIFIKSGAGLVIPKTNSTILGKHYDDEYAISGYVVGAEPGIRYNFLRNFFVSASIKAAYANYNKFRIAEGHGSQSWFSAQFNLMAGIQLSH